jgi:hypothetical protein
LPDRLLRMKSAKATIPPLNGSEGRLHQMARSHLNGRHPSRLAPRCSSPVPYPADRSESIYAMSFCSRMAVLNLRRS